MAGGLSLEERFQLIGIATSLVCYGINLSLLTQLSATVKQAKFWTTATTFISFLVVSTSQLLSSYVTLLGCADRRDNSEEAVTCFGIQQLAGSWLVIRSTALIATLIPDFFVLYQCYTVYSLRRRDLWMFGFPALFLLSSFGTGIYLLVLSTDTRLEILPHYPLCIFTKLLLTSLIVAKLLRHRNMLRENFEGGSEELIHPYTSLVHILIQSYALYASLSILFLGLYLAGNTAWRMVLPNSVQAGLMSHLLVRLQVMRTHNKNKLPGPGKNMSSIRFSATSSHISTSNPMTGV